MATWRVRIAGKAVISSKRTAIRVGRSTGGEARRRKEGALRGMRASGLVVFAITSPQ